MTPTILTAAAVTALKVDALVTASDPAARTITGRVVTWNETGHTSAGPARFLPNSLAASDPRRVKLLIEHDPNRPVGFCSAITPDPAGVLATFTIPAGADGDAALASAGAGLRDGLSVGVEIDAAERASDGTLEVSAARWRETSLVSVPAYADSIVSTVAASAAPVNPAAVARQVARVVAAPARPVQAAPARPVARAATALDLEAQFAGMAAAYRAGGPDALVRAALSDVVLPTDQAERDAIIPPQWVGLLWQARLGTTRPLIDSISKKPLTSIRVTGYRKVYPWFGVDDYTGNKAAVPSPGTYDFEVASADAKRIAGAHDVDRIFMDLGDFGDQSFLSAYFEAQTDNYMAKTEENVSADLLAAATVEPVPVGTALEAIIAGAQYLASIGANVSFVKVSPDLFGEIIAIKATDAPWLFGGSANVVDGTANVGGISISTSTELPAATVLVGDKRCATYYEWSPTPLKVQAINIPNGGIDLGVFGYYALLINDAAALYSMTVGEVTPPANGGE